MKLKLDAEGNVVLDEHGNPVLVDDEGKEVPVFSADYVRQLRDEAKNYRIEKNKLKQDFDELKAKIDAVDFEELERIRQEKENADKKVLEDEKNFAALKEKMLSEHKKEIDKREKEMTEFIEKYDKLEKEYHETLILSEVSAAAQEAEAFSHMDIFYRIGKSARVVVSDAGEKTVQIFDGEHPVVDGTGKPITIKQRVAELKADKDTAHLFKGGNYGGNSHSGNHGLTPGENPWKTGNLTRQAEVFKSDPALAKRLAADAGKKIHSMT